MSRRVDERFIFDLVSAKGRSERIARYMRIKPWFNAFLYVVALGAAAAGIFFGDGPTAGIFMMLLVLPFTLYIDLYIKLMAAFEAAGIDYET